MAVGEVWPMWAEISTTWSESTQQCLKSVQGWPNSVHEWSAPAPKLADVCPTALLRHLRSAEASGWAKWRGSPAHLSSRALYGTLARLPRRAMAGPSAWEV